MQKDICLITGGAGYIGSHIADVFLKNGKNVVIYDSLSNGLASRIEYLNNRYGRNIPFIIGDIRDESNLEKILEEYSPKSIIHTAALKSVAASILNPVEYNEVNYHSTASLLILAKKHGVQKFIFSSTAAVYGNPSTGIPIKEDTETTPISPYGESKLAAEKIVHEFLAIPGNLGTSFRFFNVVGTAAPELVDNSIDNLIPILMENFRRGKSPIVFGSDYETRDGTCVRDYVDVRDVARVHFEAHERNQILPDVLNVGTGLGNSVDEVIQIVSRFFGLQRPRVIYGSRRNGDPGTLLADTQRVKDILNFTPQFSLEESISSLFYSEKSGLI